jgi:DNA-directed RNA polymerase beta' subunit
MNFFDQRKVVVSSFSNETPSENKKWNKLTISKGLTATRGPVKPGSVSPTKFAQSPNTRYDFQKRMYSTYSKFTEVKLVTIGIASPLRILQWAEKTLPNGKIYGEVLNANTLHHKTFKPQKGGLFCERIFGPIKDFECSCGKIDKSPKYSLRQFKNHIIGNRTGYANSRKTPNSMEKRSVELSPISSSDLNSHLLQHFQTNQKDDFYNSERTQDSLGSGIASSPSAYLAPQGSTKKLRKFCPNCDVEHTWSVIRRYQLGYIKLNSPVTHVWFLKGTPSYLSILLDIKKRNLQSIVYGTETFTLEHSNSATTSFQTYRASFNLDSPSKIYSSWTQARETGGYYGFGQELSKSLGDAQDNKTFSNQNFKFVNIQPRNNRRQGLSENKISPFEETYYVCEALACPTGTRPVRAVRQARGAQNSSDSPDLKNRFLTYKERRLNTIKKFKKQLSAYRETSLIYDREEQNERKMREFIYNFLNNQISHDREAPVIKDHGVRSRELPDVKINENANQEVLKTIKNFSLNDKKHFTLNLIYLLQNSIIYNDFITKFSFDNIYSKDSRIVKICHILRKVKKKLPLDLYIKVYLTKSLQKKILSLFILKTWKNIYKKAYLKAIYKTSSLTSYLNNISENIPRDQIIQGFRDFNSSRRSPHDQRMHSVIKDHGSFAGIRGQILLPFLKMKKISSSKLSYIYLNYLIQFVKTEFKKQMIVLLQNIKHSPVEHMETGFAQENCTVKNFKFKIKNQTRSESLHLNNISTLLNQETHSQERFSSSSEQIKNFPRANRVIRDKSKPGSGALPPSMYAHARASQKNRENNKEFYNFEQKVLLLRDTYQMITTTSEKMKDSIFSFNYNEHLNTQENSLTKLGYSGAVLSFGRGRREAEYAESFRAFLKNSRGGIVPNSSTSCKFKDFIDLLADYVFIYPLIIGKYFEKIRLNLFFPDPPCFEETRGVLKDNEKPLAIYDRKKLPAIYDSQELSASEAHGGFARSSSLGGFGTSNGSPHRTRESKFHSHMFILSKFLLDVSRAREMRAARDLVVQYREGPKAGLKIFDFTASHGWSSEGLSVGSDVLRILPDSLLNQSSDPIKRLRYIRKQSTARYPVAQKITPSAKHAVVTGISSKNQLKTGKISAIHYGRGKVISRDRRVSGLRDLSAYQNLQNKKRIYNNVYTLSHRERWGYRMNDGKDWQIFLFYNTAPSDYNDQPIFYYRSRISTETNEAGTSLYSTDTGPRSHDQKARELSGLSGCFSHGPHGSRALRAREGFAVRPINNSFVSGPGIIQQLLLELTLPEMKKLDKQNRLLLHMLNKSIFKLKKQIQFFTLPQNSHNMSLAGNDSAEPLSQSTAPHLEEGIHRIQTEGLESTLGITARTRPSRIEKTVQIEIKELCKRRDSLIRRTRLVRKLFRKNSEPSSMILTVLPVLPPDLRPIVKMGNQIAASDLNRFYQRIIYRNDRLKKFLKDPATSHSYEMKYAQRLLQESVDNLIQNGQNGGEKDARGRVLKSLSDILKGKQGRFRQFLLGKRVDYSGRSVIVVGPRLKLYECGIPLEMALELFLPFLLKKILNKNYAKTVVGAKNLMKTNRPLTLELLREIMQTSPVLLNRAPTLHRLGFQAFLPKLIEGRAVLLHPLVCSAFNADFDGDQMAVHVPITVEARAEAWKLMLSRNNMLSPATGDPLSIPSQDMVLGCYYLTTNSNKSTLSLLRGSGLFFNNLEKVLFAYYLNKIDLHALVWVKWSGLIENGNDQEEPVEIRLSNTGTWQELSYNYLRTYDHMSQLITQYISTTPGRILFYSLLQNL